MSILAKAGVVAIGVAVSVTPVLAQSADNPSLSPDGAVAAVGCADPAVVEFTITDIVRRMLGYNLRVTATIRNLGDSDWSSAGAPQTIVVGRIPADGGRAEGIDGETFVELASGAEMVLTSAVQSGWQTDGAPQASFEVRIEYAEGAATSDCDLENNVMTLSGEEIQALLAAQE